MELLLGEIIGFLFLSLTISVWFLLASTSLHEEFVLFGSHFMSALLDLVSCVQALCMVFHDNFRRLRC